MHAMRHKNCKKLATFSKKKQNWSISRAKFYFLHALADGTQCIRISEKTLEFSSTLSSTLSPYPELLKFQKSKTRLCPQTTRCSPAKPVHVALNGGVQVALEPIHDKQHSRKPSPTPGAVLVVDDRAVNRRDPLVFRDVSAPRHTYTS